MNTTRNVRHETAETGKSTLITFDEVNGTALEAYAPVARDVAETGEAKLLESGKYRARGTEQNDKLTVDLYCSDYDFCIMSMTVCPPESDGADAKSVTSLAGVGKIKAMHDGVLTEEIRNMLELLGDMSRTLAWAWLMYRKHIRTYA